MKCSCAQCEGTGKVICDDCNGSGLAEFELLKLTPSRFRFESQENWEALMQLASAARDVTRQYEELKQLMPHNAEKYEDQYRSIMDQLENEASRLYGR